MSVENSAVEKSLDSYRKWLLSRFPGAVTLATGYSRYELLGLSGLEGKVEDWSGIMHNYPEAAGISKAIVSYVASTGTTLTFSTDREVAGVVASTRPQAVEICGSWLEACVVGALSDVLRVGVPAVINHRLVLSTSRWDVREVEKFLNDYITEKNRRIVPQGMKFHARQLPEVGATYFTPEFL